MAPTNKFTYPTVKPHPNPTKSLRLTNKRIYIGISLRGCVSPN